MNMPRKNCYILSFIFVLIAIFILPLTNTYGDETKIQPDSVIIQGEYYQIPPLWLGHKIGNKTDSIPDNLAMLPREYGQDSSRIYVTKETRAAFLAMIKQAEKDSVFFKVKSGFRSYSFQAQIFARRMNEGKSFARVAKDVAPPGYSEHMLGTALDLITDTIPFAHSRAYLWLKANAGKFGFIESYPDDSASDFSWEAWHWRYVGTDSDSSKQ
jgi:LAS superfamily LD-carboxypeptidase LdcB